MSRFQVSTSKQVKEEEMYAFIYLHWAGVIGVLCWWCSWIGRNSDGWSGPCAMWSFSAVPKEWWKHTFLHCFGSLCHIGCVIPTLFRRVWEAINLLFWGSYSSSPWYVCFVLASWISLISQISKIPWYISTDASISTGFCVHGCS